MTDETAQDLINFPQCVIEGRHSWDLPDLQRMATLWLMRDELLHIVKESAETPISGTDSSCGFCNSYDFTKNGHLKTLDGKECPSTVAQRLFKALEEV